MEKVKASGAEVVREEMPAGDMAYVGYFMDTEGNLVGLWQDKNSKSLTNIVFYV